MTRKMTEAEQFAMADAMEGNTMIVFSSKAVAMRYIQHRYKEPHISGVLVGREDTREGTGLFVLWRDPVAPHEIETRMENCLWLLEETLAGRSPMPKAGDVEVLWQGGQRLH
jgi:hypothetical protein